MNENRKLLADTDVLTERSTIHQKRCFKLVLLVTLILSVTSVGLTGTHISHFISATGRCNSSVHKNSTDDFQFLLSFEIGMVVWGDISQVIAYASFFWFVAKEYSNKRGSKWNVLWETFKNVPTLNCKFKTFSMTIIYLFLALIISLAVATPILGGLRDVSYKGKFNCNGPNLKLIIPHATFKFIHFFTGTMVVFFAVIIFSNSVCKWQNASEDLCKKNISSDGSIDDTIVQKYYYLYKSYLKIGQKTKTERSALKRWFIVQYVTYLVTILMRLIHVIKHSTSNSTTLGPSARKCDAIHSYLLIGFASLAFLVPYAMAVWMNNFHHKYYKTMCNAYTNLRISGCKNNIHIFELENVDSVVSTIQDEARKPFYGTLKPDTCPKSPEDAEKLIYNQGNGEKNN